MRRAAVALAALLTACAGATSVSTTPEASAPRPTATTTAARTTTTESPDAVAARTSIGLEVTGPEEVVFDWTTDACEPEHIPDITARAIRDTSGQVSLYVAHYVTYRMVGPDLDSVVTDCSAPVHTSDFDSDPAMFDDSEWLASPYTEDGETVWAIVHNEYRGDTHGITGQCASGERLPCLDTSLTMARSTDGGRTFTDIVAPPGHLLATQPYTYDDDGRPTGFRQPSNIVPGGDGYYYVFSNVSEYPLDGGVWENQWVCVMRTDDLDDPASWRYWDGEAFAGEFVDPYREEPDSDRVGCAPLALPQLGGGVQESVTWSDALDAWVMIGAGDQPGSPEQAWGYYYSTSSDLLTWSARRLLLELPLSNTVADNSHDLFYAYPTLLDPESGSMSFDTFGDDGYLYLARLNEGGGSLDRDLVRFPVSVVTRTVEPPMWAFDSDTEGWDPTWDVSEFAISDGTLSFTTTGTDPYLVGPGISLPADAYGTLTIRMAVSSGDLAQVFFGTEASPDHVEERSVVFELRPDGEFHDYVLDMASVTGWDGTILGLRLDPTDVAGATVAIDAITISG